MNRFKSIMSLYSQSWFCRIQRCFLSRVCDTCLAPRLQRLYGKNTYTRLQTNRYDTHCLSIFGCIITLRGFHRSQSAYLSKILSVEEIFSRPSLKEYLNRVEDEYDASLKSINSMESQSFDEEELSQKRTRLSVLTPLVQQIRDLKLQQKELEETEALLKGEQNLIAVINLPECLCFKM